MYNQYPGQYPPPQGQYPPPQGQYPPAQGYPPQHSSPYPPQGSQYPPPQGGYGGYGGYGGGAPVELPGSSSYPPQGQYPPQNSGSYPSQGGHQPYAAPLPQSSYGAPPPGPPPGQYGAPPPQQYGAPQYALPPGGGGGPPTLPSPGYGPPQIIQWDAGPDAQALRMAMKGMGTDEKALIRVLANKDPHQVEAIKAAYSRLFSRSLEKDIKSETSGYLELGLVGIISGPLLHDVQLLHSAMDGLGTKEKVLNDVLLGRSNADMRAIKSMYQRAFNRSLESAVKGDLSMKTERHFMIVLGACRAEDSAPVIPQAIDQDVMEIYRATEGKTGTDEMLVCSILSTRNDNQIRAISHTYEQKFRRRLEEVIKKEFSGHMEDALLFQLRNAVDKYMHAARLLEDSMAGMGTKDQLLVSRVVRYHWNRQELENIKGAYKQRYGKSLASRIRGETRGDYERLMVACVGE
ncbi:putative annexin A7 [Rosellinia necatrix]|uniref:Annexin n=1 Tax=Rosellinia necatrix TaxID=77044 RepID=A0A1W2TDF7_ROSNE|nr:putative annexin A7 [Rosellinia necatrix]